ncbi:MAG: HEPN domain-containing protein [Ruminococcus flavefaciens]
MERHIGTWYKENEKDKTEVGELVIDGNNIEFYSRFCDPVFPTAFIGGDEQYSYKIFVNGLTNGRQNRTIENTTPHRVFYVLMQNIDFSKGLDISGITEFSFIIPELINWLGMKTVFYCNTSDDEPAAGEYHMPPITIRTKNPKIEIYFESSSFENAVLYDDATKITISKVPRISVSYEEAVDIQAIFSEIECLMQFFGLLIGKVSIVEDIRLTIKDQELKSWLYINHDFSYNILTQSIIDTPRTYFYIVEDKLEMFFANWYAFFYNDDFSLLRRIYFSVNNKENRFAEEVFIEYMRFLDGYHTRISGDAETEKALKAALTDAKKVIKSCIFTEDNRPVFEQAIQKVLPDWKYNARNVGDISEWIASGYLGRKSLSHRLKELDKNFYSIISHNALEIKRLNRHSDTSENIEEDLVIEQYFKELGDTRNYYSHYKKDKTGVLNFSQLSESIKVLKATIISILLSHIGLEDIGRRMVAFDSELNFQTMFLREEGEKPFLRPAEYYRKRYE